MTTRVEIDRRHPLIALAAVLALVFVFGSSWLIVGIAAWSCVAHNECSELNGLSHVVTAWAGAFIGGVVGSLLGGRQDDASDAASHEAPGTPPA